IRFRRFGIGPGQAEVNRAAANSIPDFVGDRQQPKTDDPVPLCDEAFGNASEERAIDPRCDSEADDFDRFGLGAAEIDQPFGEVAELAAERIRLSRRWVRSPPARSAQRANARITLSS